LKCAIGSGYFVILGLAGGAALGAAGEILIGCRNHRRAYQCAESKC
jgi:hypothetical protein